MTVGGAGAARRVRVRVEGTVQGVGFRPFVFRLASELGLAGWVLNDERGVLLEIEGDAAHVESLTERLVAEAPPLAAITDCELGELEPTGEAGFRIVASSTSGEAHAPVSADTATCEDCLAELFDPADRRFRYPFVNCTNCGPRFTIVTGVPYDRPLTTMASFEMCGPCRTEYEDPGDRRFHAQPNACPRCGPMVALHGAGEEQPRAEGEAALRAAAELLRAGRVLAVKGIGGFHLACRADHEQAVSALRARKHREDRPFALMVADLPGARSLAHLSAEDEALLAGRDRPIVIAPRRTVADVARAVAPRSADLGLMLPYSPLHHLLLGDVGRALVMTSGNVSDEPIAYRDDDARERLAPIADALLVHDRPIATRTDDSVVRTARPGGRPRALVLRRSRGRVPEALPLAPSTERPLLACGAELKSAFCVAKGARAWVSHHIGDLGNWETLSSFREGIAHFEALFAVAPELVVHDLHPDYLSTAYALERTGVEHVAVQHHHAHLAACLAEHGETGDAVGAIYDGSGYGSDGSVWGGEILVGGQARCERAGFLLPVRLPGGDRAVREPWRMACAWLATASGDHPALPAALADQIGEERWRAVARLVATGTASPWTSSVGRLFDAVAALCGLRAEVSYEGQAAAELEAACAPGERGAYPLEVTDGGTTLDARATVLAVAADVAAGVDRGVVSARFHRALAGATAKACAACASGHGLDTAVLSGGVFQNRVLLELTWSELERAGLRALIPERLPPNDGGVAYGQAAVAAATTAC